MGASALALSGVACVGVGAAHADVTVSGGSTPVTTATASASGADNIAQTGTLTVTSGPAITLNSSDSVTNSGTIQVQDVSGVTGILALGGQTGSITNTGQITFNQTNTLTSTDSAGNVVGPFASDGDIYGIRVTGPGTLNGDILSSGAITIQGAQSYGVSVETGLGGSITTSGAIGVSGTGSVGIRTTDAVAGGVTLGGSVAAAGQGAQAVSIGGDVGGGLVVGAAVSSTGYHTLSRSTDAKALADQNLADALQGGDALTVAGSLGKGLLVAAPPSVLSSTVADVNGDGIVDSAETTGSVLSYGSARAIVIGATGRDIQLGLVGRGDSAYGLVLEGLVTGSGLRDGVGANGVQIGVDGGGAVSIAGGIRVANALTATAYAGDATALHLVGRASAPVLYNSSRITASMTGETANLADAIVVEPGGLLPTILNAGTISGTIVGSGGSAAAIIDRSGSLSRLENTGAIVADVTPPAGSTIPVTGATTAIDASLNTTGFTLLSYQGATYTVAPSISGAVWMGSGDDTVNVQAGTLTGDLTFGAGANSLVVDGGASVIGAVSADGGTLALSVGTGSLQINSANHLAMRSLSLGAGSALVLTADPAAGSATELDVAGAANIAQGAKLGLRVISLAGGPATYTLIHASQLTAGDLSAGFTAATPYLYDAALATDTAAGTVSVALSRKTADELALPASIAGAYEPVVAVAAGNTGLSLGLLTPADRGGFMSAFNQLLPEHSGGVFQLTRAASEAFGRPLDDRQTPDGHGVWLEEINLGAVQRDKDALPGYKSWGVGLIAGFEAPATRLGVFGATVGGFSGELRPHGSPSDSQLTANVIEAGGYWRAVIGRVSLNGRIAADRLLATNRRAVSYTSDDQTLFSGTANGHWSGWGVTSRFRASYEARAGAYYVRPQLGLDYQRLAEDAYQEGGDSVLDLAVGRRTTSELSGFAGVAVGAVFGEEGASWGPELMLGYHDAFHRGGGGATARFLSGGDSFEVGPDPASGSGAVARVALKSENAWGAVALEGGADVQGELTSYDAKLAVHLRF